MNVGLFIPCYVNQFYPQVAIATLELLEKLGVEVSYPANQTCCGQPMANSGFEKTSEQTYNLFIKNFHSYDFIVAPSGSCVYHVRNHLNTIEQTDEVKHVRNKTYELCEFLVKIIKKDFSIPGKLLNNVKGIQLVQLDRPDECCGFGGTFAVAEEAVSIKMGNDRIQDHIAHNAEVITATDMSCLMHLKGIIRRRNLSVQVKHIAEILNSN